jgi:hypothetical protein
MNGFLSSNATVQFKKGNFKKKQNMIYERRAHATCKAGNYVFVSGGINSKSEPMESCEKFCLREERWYRLANMLKPKTHHSLCAVNGEHIYSICGENRVENLLDSIERYTVNVDYWELMNVKIPFRMECVGTIQVNTDILILGGFNCEYGQVKTVFVYDTNNNTIRKANKELPQCGWSIYQPIKQGNNIHIFFGGEDEFPPHHVTYTH